LSAEIDRLILAKIEASEEQAIEEDDLRAVADPPIEGN
jgi:hypothetical protein